MLTLRTETNIIYLPLPNVVETIRSAQLPPLELIATAFVIPVIQETGEIVFVDNRRRSRVEIPGGHLEKNETAEMAAVREAFEETGCVVASLKPIGFLKMTLTGGKPEGYNYPYPTSYQQFFSGIVVARIKYTPNDECDEPITMEMTDWNMSKLSTNNQLFVRMR